MARETGIQSQVESDQTQKMILDISLLNSQYYKVHIKDKMAQSRSVPLHLNVVAIEKRAIGSSMTTLGQLYLLIHMCVCVLLFKFE